MTQLPVGLQALAEFDQFVVVKKHSRVPVDPATLEAIDPYDPRHWLSATDALITARMFGGDYGVSFVLTENDPFWFLDIDHCLEPGPPSKWSDLALSLVNLLAGCAVEVSRSGEGLHLIGKGLCPPHGCRNIAHRIELYTEKRCMALIGTEVTGDAGADLSQALGVLVANYFPPPAYVSEDTEWTTSPDPAWCGPTDDAELIEKARATKSIKSQLGAGASFDDLWTRNEGVLGRMWPAVNRPYDASYADAALAQHLAFWTGKDCARIQRLMERSGLVRDKWKRDDYLPRTIINAVSKQQEVYASRKYEPQKAVSQEVAGLQFMSADEQRRYFDRCVYIRHLHRVWIPDGSLLSPEQFKAHFGGYIFSLDTINDKTTRNAWEVFTQSQAVRFPKVALSCFRPERAPGEIVEEEGLLMVNTYVPINTASEEGDVSPFLNHLAKMIPNQRDRTILLTYMASMVQNPGVKFQWCPLVQGVEGNGKTLLSSVLAEAIGHRYTHTPNASDLASGGLKFNSWIQNKLFICMEEIYVTDRREVTEALKPLITNPRVEIQGKGVDQYTGDNRANWMMFSNHKDGIHIKVDGRRYCVFYTAQQSRADKEAAGMTGSYFPNLYNWLRGGGYRYLTHFLRNMPLAAEFDPAGICQEAPVTSSTDEAVLLSLGPVEQAVMDRVDEGKPGFANGWVSSKAFDALLEELRVAGRIPIQRRRTILQELGYDWHPSLVGGRASTFIVQEGGRPRLYLKRGHMALNLATPRAIVERYMTDQNYVDGGVNTPVQSTGQS
jgi:hypothetical protein